ncbi:MAG: hypothetical protein C4567_06630 [Deltaproteobacteria bacterium]|nr:MAG: hypothetical protein C4567_06630 [Deltaproteobacteria bacterium]
MNRVTKISAWLALWLFIASAPAIFPGAVAAAHSGKTPGTMQTVQYDEDSGGRVPRGILDIRIQSDTGGSPPGELVLIDPAGDSTGPEDTDIHLRNPMSGLYHLRVIGEETGEYTLFLKAYSRSGGSSDVRFPHMSIQDGDVHHYRIYFSVRGPKLDVRRTRITKE